MQFSGVFQQYRRIADLDIFLAQSLRQGSKRQILTTSFICLTLALRRPRREAGLGSNQTLARSTTTLYLSIAKRREAGEVEDASQPGFLWGR